VSTRAQILKSWHTAEAAAAKNGILSVNHATEAGRILAAENGDAMNAIIVARACVKRSRFPEWWKHVESILTLVVREEGDAPIPSIFGGAGATGTEDS
jgi:hypothetical protein